MNQFLYNLSYPLFLTGLWAASPFSSKIRRGFSERRGLSKRVRGAWPKGERALWFHVASSGELEQCLPLMDAAKRTKPSRKIFLSYFSPTAKKALELEEKRRALAGLTLPCDVSDYSPLDFERSIAPLIKVLRPTHFVAINREIWPRLLESARKSGARCFLLASYFSPPTRRRTRWFKPWLVHFELIGTTEPSTKEFLATLSIPSVRIEALGDPRVERVLDRKKLAKESRWQERFESRPVFLAASLWEEDIRAIEAGIKALQRLEPAWRLILVPHEPTDSAIQRLQSLLGPGARKWTDWVKTPDETSPIIVDTVGQLAELYRYAKLVFVGGSFKGRVHNVLEPAAYHVPILTGPHIENSGEALEMRSAGALFSTADAAHFHQEVSRLAGSDKVRRDISEQLRRYLDERRGASLRYLAALGI